MKKQSGKSGRQEVRNITHESAASSTTSIYYCIINRFEKQALFTSSFYRFPQNCSFLRSLYGQKFIPGCGDAHHLYSSAVLFTKTNTHRTNQQVLVLKIFHIFTVHAACALFIRRMHPHARVHGKSNQSTPTRPSDRTPRQCEHPPVRR